MSVCVCVRIYELSNVNVLCLESTRTSVEEISVAKGEKEGEKVGERDERVKKKRNLTISHKHLRLSFLWGGVDEQKKKYIL